MRRVEFVKLLLRLVVLAHRRGTLLRGGAYAVPFPDDEAAAASVAPDARYGQPTITYRGRRSGRRLVVASPARPWRPTGAAWASGDPISNGLSDGAPAFPAGLVEPAVDLDAAGSGAGSGAGNARGSAVSAAVASRAAGEDPAAWRERHEASARRWAVAAEALYWARPFLSAVLVPLVPPLVPPLVQSRGQTAPRPRAEEESLAAGSGGGGSGAGRGFARVATRGLACGVGVDLLALACRLRADALNAAAARPPHADTHAAGHAKDGSSGDDGWSSEGLPRARPVAAPAEACTAATRAAEEAAERQRRKVAYWYYLLRAPLWGGVTEPAVAAAEALVGDVPVVGGIVGYAAAFLRHSAERHFYSEPM